MRDEYFPSATSHEDLFGRLQALRSGGFHPNSMIMAPEVWERLADESAFAVAVAPSDLRFDGVPVRLDPKAITVGITYTKAGGAGA